VVILFIASLNGHAFESVGNFRNFFVVVAGVKKQEINKIFSKKMKEW
jgi:hypothetical protein